MIVAEPMTAPETAKTFQPDQQPYVYPVLFARFMLPDSTEHACQATALSLDGATFLTNHVPVGGTQIVAYLEDVGRVEGVSAEAVPGGFQVVFPHTGARRERFAARLEWLKDRTGGAGPDSRRHTRFEPADSKSHITLPDGRVYPCEVIDISLSGAALKVDVIPGLGTYVMLGKMRGRIVRYLDNGIAMEFVKALEGRQLSEQVR
ncbi:PilZ domain-containing protein [soil metagenome]